MLYQSAFGQVSMWAYRIGPYRPQVLGAEFGFEWGRVFHLQVPALPGQRSSWDLREPVVGTFYSRWSPTRASNIHPRGPHLPARWH